MGAAAVLVIGLGNDVRGDDGAGLEIARRLREPARRDGIEVRELLGGSTGLLEAWTGLDVVVIVDATRSGAAPGMIRRLDASHRSLPRSLGGSSSTHAVDLGEAIELARALGRLPSRVIVYAVEGRRFDAGSGFSDELQAALPTLATIVLREASALAASLTEHPR